jgi:hypothetical protein
VIGLSIDLSPKTAKIIVKELNEIISVSITIEAMTFRKIKNHWLSKKSQLSYEKTIIFMQVTCRLYKRARSLYLYWLFINAHLLISMRSPTKFCQMFS